jgi:phytoene synthase
MERALTSFPLDSGLEGHSSSFFYSFTFLPKTQREALKTVYAFCRHTDDIVDNERDAKTNLERLHQWRNELELSANGGSQYQILNKLNSIARTFAIPVDHFYELLKGVEMDLTKKRYASFNELREYCTLVASSVGLMSLEIFGPRNKQTKEYAVNLGIALQLTNILRDVSIDARYGRIYLPMEDLRRFNYSEDDLFARRYTPEFRALMEFETARAEEYFLLAQQSLPAEDKRAMFAAKIMERIYYHTLLRIKRARFNVFDQTVHLPNYLQLLIAVKYWIKQRVFGI